MKGKNKEIERLKRIIEEQENLYQKALDKIELKKIKIRRLNNIIEKAIKELEDNDCDEVSYYVSIPYIIDILKGNDEAETKEDKKIEKIDFKEQSDCGYLKMKIYSNQYNHDMSKADCIIADKINEIIDYINKGE